MPEFDIRPFQRADRDQVTGLVNQHIGAVMPGCSVSVNAVLSQLEREPGEPIVDPWVAHREAWVAVHRDRIVAAALLHRYAADGRVSDPLRNAADIRWLVALPAWPTGDPAFRGLEEQGQRLVAHCVATMRDWGAARILADPSLPAPGVYGVPEAWPHVGQLLTNAGFTPRRSEFVYLADVADLPAAGAPPIDGLTVCRDVGSMSTRFVGHLDGSMIGYVEVNTDLTLGGLRTQYSGIGDIDNVHVEPAWQRRGVATWLMGHAGDWMRLGRIDRVLNYADAVDEEQHPYREWMAKLGWRVLTWTQRGWRLPQNTT